MADAYWRYSSGGQHVALPPALTPLVANRPRNEYAPSGPGYYERGMMRDTDSMEAPYERYLRNGPISSMHSGIMGIGGSNPDRLAFRNRNIVGMVGGRPEVNLPPNASSTLFVEHLPADCTRREVSHIFRHFRGYKKVRLVPKGSRHARDNPLKVLCFVYFTSPLQAAAAMDTLQGYKFDQHEHDSIHLMLQFARNPSVRSGGQNRGKR